LGLDPDLVEHVIRTYGARHGEIFDYVESDRELLARVSPGYPDIMAQVVHAIEHEGAHTLADVMLRRLTLGLAADRGRDSAESVAAMLAPRLKWDAGRTRDEIAAFHEQLALGAAPEQPEPSSLLAANAP
jgi:glycerol-3-phosphate dehydrogenase